MDRIKDFFNNLFSNKRSNTIFIIAMVLIIVGCGICIVIAFMPSIQGQSKYQDLASSVVAENPSEGIKIGEGNAQSSMEYKDMGLVAPNPDGSVPQSGDPATTDGNTNQDDSLLGDGYSDELPPTTDSGSAPRTTADPNANKDPNDFVVRTLSVNFSELQRQNSDTCGWIYLQDSEINYPVMEAPVDDPAFYLTHTFYKEESIMGALYIDPSAKADFSARNTIIHGHRMNSGAMFGSLYKYKRQTYYNANPVMSLYCSDGNSYYLKIFAAYEDDVRQKGSFGTEADFEKYLSGCVNKSVINTLVTPTSADRIVTLSTCVIGNDATRMIVQGVLVPME